MDRIILKEIDGMKNRVTAARRIKGMKEFEGFYCLEITKRIDYLFYSKVANPSFMK